MTNVTPHGTDAGFHSGELEVQSRAGVRREAARLSDMLGPVQLSAGLARYLAGQTFMAVTGRDTAGRLWTSPLVGPPGFVEVRSRTELAVHAMLPGGDPLHGMAVGQKLGTTVVDFPRRRRVRINGVLTVAEDDLLVVEVEQAYGNCPQYIHPHVFTRNRAAGSRSGIALDPADADLIRSADTFFLGTVNPVRGADASHRGGPPGFVRIDGNRLRWPDYPGNNMFNSLGNLAVDPEAALLFLDFTTGASLHLSGTARTEWDDAERRTVSFEPERLASVFPAR